MVLFQEIKMCSNDVLKESVDSMKEQLQEYKKAWEDFRKENLEDHKEMTRGLLEIKDTLTDFILEAKTTFITKDKADDKFASKLTEKMVYSVSGFILMSVIWAIIYLVINK